MAAVAGRNRCTAVGWETHKATSNKLTEWSSARAGNQFNQWNEAKFKEASQICRESTVRIALCCLLRSNRSGCAVEILIMGRPLKGVQRISRTHPVIIIDCARPVGVFRVGIGEAPSCFGRLSRQRRP